MSDDKRSSGTDSLDLESILAEYASSRRPAEDAVRGEEPPAEAESPNAPAASEVPEKAVHLGPVSWKEKDLPWPEAPHREHPDNIVAFPGTDEEDDEGADSDEPAGEFAGDGDEFDEDGEDFPEEDFPEEDDGEPDGEEEEEDSDVKVLQFPKETTHLSALLEHLRSKSDAHAARMYEDAGPVSKKTRRIETLVPGVDIEDEPEDQPYRAFRHEEPLPDDVPLKELSARCSHGLKPLHLRSRLTLLPALLLLYLSLAGTLSLPLPEVLASSYVLQVYLSACLLAVGMLLVADLLVKSALNLIGGRCGMESLICLACLVTLVDACTMLPLGGHGGVLPLCVVSAFSLYFLSHGEYLLRSGTHTACRTASSAETPDLVTLDPERWNGQDTYCKHPGHTDGFGSQLLADDGARQIFRRAVPVLMALSLVFALVSSLGQRRPELILWCLSVCLTACASFAGPIAYARPFCRLTRRLHSSGAAVGGWPAACRVSRRSFIQLEDRDLFPPRCVELLSPMNYSGFSPEQALSAAASVLRAVDSGIAPLFCDRLRATGGIFRNVSQLKFHEGGYSARIGNDEVLVGSGAFMELMRIHIEPGCRGKATIFCAIRGKLAGSFPILYTLDDSVYPAVDGLLGEGIEPLLATRDCNIIPAMLGQVYKLPTARMQFPSVERRCELSDPHSPHAGLITAVLCAEGPGPYSMAVTGCHRLFSAVRLTAVLSLIGSVLGLLLALFLTWHSAFQSLAPENMLVFQLAWLVPAILIGNWTTRY